MLTFELSNCKINDVKYQTTSINIPSIESISINDNILTIIMGTGNSIVIEFEDFNSMRKYYKEITDKMNFNH